MNHHLFSGVKMLMDLRKNNHFERDPPLLKIHETADLQISFLKIYSRDCSEF